MFRVFIFLLSPLVLFAKTLFTQETILEYLNENNPYYYATMAQERVAKESQRIYSAAFDTQLNLKYDKKEYPTTVGEYQQLDLTKSIGNGMEFSAAYRNAQDTQEYNNIKTGKDGELFTSIKIPILSLINNTSKNQLDFNVAKLQTKTLTQTSRKNLLALYLVSSKAYFELLLYKDIYKTEEALLQKAQQNYQFVLKEVQSGKLAQIALMDVKSQIINRKQRLITAKNQYQSTKNNFLKYLNISEEKFNELYTLSSIKKELLFEEELGLEIKEKILLNRPEFQELEYKLDRVNLQSEYNSIRKYPKLDFKLYGVYDLAYEKEGYKISMEFNFPLERTDYSAKNETYKKEVILLKNSKETIKNDIRTNIRTIKQKLTLQKSNIELAKEEIKLVGQLEIAEKRRYQEGMSSLLFINQREMLTLQAKQKLLRYHFTMQILNLQLRYELGTLLQKLSN
ncbi:MAG: TolC family protein [Sulfurimonas sp.]|nr:TolC family protein [Sulfurimonas sp.]